jgi:hypothetical protein
MLIKKIALRWHYPSGDSNGGHPPPKKNYPRVVSSMWCPPCGVFPYYLPITWLHTVFYKNNVYKNITAQIRQKNKSNKKLTKSSFINNFFLWNQKQTKYYKLILFSTGDHTFGAARICKYEGRVDERERFFGLFGTIPSSSSTPPGWRHSPESNNNNLTTLFI